MGDPWIVHLSLGFSGLGPMDARYILDLLDLLVSGKESDERLLTTHFFYISNMWVLGI